MQDMDNFKKKYSIFFVFLLLFFTVIDIFYVKFLPKIINIPEKVPEIEKFFSDKTGYELKITNPELKTFANFAFSVSLDEVCVYNSAKEVVFSARNPLIKIQPLKIFLKKIKINEIQGQQIYADCTPLEYIFTKEQNGKNNFPFKIDASKATIEIDNYELVFHDKKINRKIKLKGAIFDIKPVYKNISNLTTDGALSIDKNFSVFNLNVMGNFIFGKKMNLQNFSAMGYIKNINLEILSPYLDKFTEYKQAKGILNIRFNTLINDKNEPFTEITANIKDLFFTNAQRTVQTVSKGLSTIKIRTNVHGKNLIFDEITFSSPNIGLNGNGTIYNYQKKKPSLNLMFNLSPSSVSDIADLLPFGVCKEIDIVKEKGIFGKANGVIKIAGTYPHIQLYGKADITNVQATRKFKDTHNGNIKLLFNDTTVYVTTDVKTKKGESFYLTGSGRIYDDDWSVFDVKTSENLDLPLVMEILVPVSKIFDFDIGPVPFFSISSGTGSSKLHIKGTKDIAYIDGFVKIKNAFGKFDGINADLSKVNTQVIFKGENIYFDTSGAYADNNPIHIFGEGSTTGSVKINAQSENFNGPILQKIITSSQFLEDASGIFETIEKITGKINFKVLLQGNFPSEMNPEQFTEEVAKMTIDGKLKLSDNHIKIKDFESPVIITGGEVKFSEKSAEAEKISVSFGKNSNANISFKCDMPRENDNIDGNITIEAPSVMISDSLNFVLKSAIANDLKINSPTSSDIGGQHSLSLSAKIKNNDIDLKSVNSKIKIINTLNQKSKISANSGEITLQNGNASISNLKIQSDKSVLNLNGTIKNITNTKPNYDLIVQGSNIVVKTIANISDIFPADIRNILQSCRDYDGTVNTNLKISDRGYSGFVNFKNLAFRHIQTDIPVKFADLPVTFSPHRISLEKISGEIGRTGAFPVYADVNIDNYLKIPIVKASVSMKPNSVFTERYINTKLSHPIKLTGDINISADINGSVDSLKISPVIKLNKDADISYLTVTFGDTDCLRELKSEIYLLPKNIILKKAEFFRHKMLDGKTKTEILWAAAANIAQQGKNLIPKYASFKTYHERPAKNLNFLFKKSIIKNGSFKCDIAYKADGSKITGYADIMNTEIPSYDLILKEGKMVADNNLIKISSEGKLLDTDFTLNSNIKNSAAMPVNIKDLVFTTKKLDLAKLLDTINRWSIEAYSDATLKNNVSFNVSDVIIENGLLNANHIDYKTSPIEDLKAKFSLDKDGNLNISAENFKVSEGIAENKITYNFKTGKTDCLFIAKGINSDSTAEAFLGLKNQITGKADVKVSFNTQGLTDLERFRNIKGIIYFSVKNGNMPKLGSLEYLLRASNIFYSGLTTLSINNVIELLKPFKQGTFSTITGVFNLNRGTVENLRIYSQGINMSLYMNGQYNIEDGEADIAIYGKLGKKIENLFGPLGNLSANTLFSIIPRDKNANSYNAELKKIPDIEYKNQDVKYFRATVQGNLNEKDSASSFKWLR